MSKVLQSAVERQVEILAEAANKVSTFAHKMSLIKPKGKPRPETVAFLVDDDAHKSFVEYIEKSKSTGNFPEKPLPSGVEKLAGVTVNRN